ncbi:hypothetical protein [Streptomyces sp. NBRC 110028]|uniref:hypothetical protein n=1 Tax=Streptomyces sp. NBRC 110028 TaxID=1621260 RepID=UPI0006E13BC9|nr:hypothetical protein [Streptomyces sp. NBRC 110028]
MEFAKAAWDPELHGFRVDPTAYLAELPRLRAALPPGAWAFASDEEHYRFGTGARCVKDLGLAGVDIPGRKGGGLTLTFEPSEWKHDTGLRIRYAGVRHFSIDYAHAIDWMETDTVLLDEILPHDAGCSHEIALTDAVIIVHCRDLEAVWGGV